MGIVEDILKALDRVPGWKRLNELPDRFEVLEKRLADLETRFDGKWVPDVCRSCGERKLRLSDVLGPMDKGMMLEQWNCTACNFHEQRVIAPTRR